MENVKWSQWNGQFGMIGHGWMKKFDVQLHLWEFEKEARKVLEKTGADHVIYGVKMYDENLEWVEVRFYLEPMDDKRFDETVASMKRVQVYAVHRR